MSEKEKKVIRKGVKTRKRVHQKERNTKGKGNEVKGNERKRVGSN